MTVTSDDLKLAGCTEEQIQQFSDCSCMAERLQLLRRQREKLLDGIHRQERQICAIDYLAHQLEKTDG